MEKMRMESTSMTAKNIEKIEAMFPNCITQTRDAEGNLKKAVNFELLHQMLAEDVAETDEAYEVWGLNAPKFGVIPGNAYMKKPPWIPPWRP